MNPSRSWNGRRIVMWVAAGAALIVGVYLLRVERNGSSTGVPGSSVPSATTGGKAPDFTLASLEGGTASLGQFRGKVVILNFWASWCAPCKVEIPDFIQLQTRYGGRGVQIIGVALDDPEPARQYAKQVGINYPVLLGDDRVPQLYGGIPGIPTTFLIDAGGTIVARYEGFRQRRVFEDALEALINP